MSLGPAHLACECVYIYKATDNGSDGAITAGDICNGQCKKLEEVRAIL